MVVGKSNYCLEKIVSNYFKEKVDVNLIVTFKSHGIHQHSRNINTLYLYSSDNYHDMPAKYMHIYLTNLYNIINITL